MAQYDVDLRDYWRIIRKRKTTILLMVCLVGLFSYGFAKFKEPKPLFEAYSAIKIDRSTNLASLLTGGYWLQSENMVTHAYILTSFPVLAQTAQRMGWLPPDVTLETIQDHKDYLAVLERLKGTVQAEHQEGTNIITIRVESEDRRDVSAIANAFAQAYREYNIQEKNKKTFETKAFIEQQLQMSSGNLKQAEQELKNFKEVNGLISLDAQTQHLLNRLDSLEAEYEKNRRERAELQSQLRLIETDSHNLVGDSKGLLFSASAGSPVYGLKTKLSDLYLKRQTLLIDFTEKHPRVREVDDQIQVVIHEAKKELTSYLKNLEARESDLTAKIRQLRRENQSLPEKALQVLRLQREVDLQNDLYSQLKEKYQETLIQESSKVEEVSLVKPAVAPSKPFNIPSKLMIVVTGSVIGLIIGVVFAFLAEVFDTSMGTIEDVEELLKLPVLGVIPFFGYEDKSKIYPISVDTSKRKRDLVTHYDPKSMAAEAFRALRTNLQFLRLEMTGKSFLITSSFVQEGKTLNVANLALCLAQAGKKVLLVDADLRKPIVHTVFGLNREPGITDYVLGNYHWKEITSSISDVMLGNFGIDDILKTPGMDNLHIVTAGTKPPNPSEILSSARFREFLKEATQEYTYVFIDAPPVLPVADATEIAPMVHGVFLVYTVGKIGRGVLKRAKSSLENVDAKVLGVILNNVKPEAGPEYFKYHSGHYYGYEEAHERRSRENKGWITRLRDWLQAGKLVRAAVFLSALVLMLVGIFWQELVGLLP